MAAYTTKLSVKDSFDEEDVSDDVDDEVFIRDGRNGYKLDEERCVKRPLMAPRRKIKHNKVNADPNLRSKSTFKILWAPCFYGILALTTFLGFIAIAVVIINFLPLSLDHIRFWHRNQATAEHVIVPCADLSVSDIWIQTFPKTTSETPIRLNDVNNDGTQDIIVGFGTGADGNDVPDYVCNLYFGRDPPCLGGLMALDGKSGQVIWRHWTKRPVLTVDCRADLTKDKVHDCVIAGKGGILHAVNGHDGSMVWQLQTRKNSDTEDELSFNVYSAQFIVDVDGDSVVDVIASHTAADSTGTIVEGSMLLISGENGRIIREVASPNQAESYYAPQVLIQPDGQEVILLGVGGTSGNTWGGIHAVPLHQLANGRQLTSQTLLISDTRGVMSPPVLADINRDGTQDIIIPLFNSTVVALDGITFKPLWNHTFSNSQTFSSATPGYFNDDNIPDFLVKYQTGLDFPIYHYSQTNVLNGETGVPLLDHPVVDSVGSQVAGLGLSIEGSGNDWMLYWTADCNGHEGSQEPFTFAKGSSLRSQYRADLCRLRFNSTMFITLWAINQHVEPPGVALYSSEWRRSIEYNNSVDFEQEVEKYLATHPDIANNQDSGPAKMSSQREPEQPAQITANTDPAILTPSYRHKSSHTQEENRSRPRPSSYDAYQPSQTYQKPQMMYPVEPDSVPVVNVGEQPPINPNVGEEERPEEAEYSLSQQSHVVRKPGSLSGRWSWAHKAGIPSSSQVPTQNIYPGASDRLLSQPQEPNPDNAPRGYEYTYRFPEDGSQNLKRFDSSVNDPRQHHQPSVLDLYQMSVRKDARDGYIDPSKYIRETVALDSSSNADGMRKKRAITTKGKPANGARSEQIQNASSSSNNENHKPDAPRKKRGVYQLTSTGTLAPPLSGKGIDLIFLSQWVTPAEDVQILTAKDEECIQAVLRAAPESGKYAGMTQEAAETMITNDCIRYKMTTAEQQPSAYTSSPPVITPRTFDPPHPDASWAYSRLQFPEPAAKSYLWMTLSQHCLTMSFLYPSNVADSGDRLRLKAWM